MPMFPCPCVVSSERWIVCVSDTQGCILRWYALPQRGMIPKICILVRTTPLSLTLKRVPNSANDWRKREESAYPGKPFDTIPNPIWIAPMHVGVGERTFSRFLFFYREDTRSAAERQSFAVRCNPFGISIIPIRIQIRNTETTRMPRNREGTHLLFIGTDEGAQLVNTFLPDTLI